MKEIMRTFTNALLIFLTIGFLFGQTNIIPQGTSAVDSSELITQLEEFETNVTIVDSVAIDTSTSPLIDEKQETAIPLIEESETIVTQVDSVIIDTSTSLLINDESDLVIPSSDSLISTTPSLDDSIATVLTDSVISTVEDTVVTSEIVEDSVAVEPYISEPIPEELMGLDYGYKGFQWGTRAGQIPKNPYMDTYSFSEDSSSIYMTATLGEDDVQMTYVFSDSGFWKVEIEYTLPDETIESNIAQFLRIEKSIYEIYGSPEFTHQNEAGPTSAYNDVLNIKYSRGYYTSIWDVVPCKILLILNSLTQTPKTDLPILEGNINLFRLVYYNPDYMVSPKENVPNAEPLPSLFDLY